VWAGVVATHALACVAGCRDSGPAPAPAVTRPASQPDPWAEHQAPGDAGPAAEPVWFPAEDVVAAQVAELAGPALRGRGSGTADERRAADRVAQWMQEAGAEPGLSGRWLQPFTFEDGRTSQNVVGVIVGSDPAAGHVVVGAHYDHLGEVDGRIHPGADDNASGVAGLVGIAAALFHAGQRPRLTVVLVAFGAEEAGLHGSAHYAANPVRPLDRAVVMVNLDMIGRPEFLSAAEYRLARLLVPARGIGAITAPGGGGWVERARVAAVAEGRPLVSAGDFGSTVEAAIRPLVEYRGDHRSFAVHGVPYLWLSTSMHDDYHRPSDTADRVDPGTVAAVGRMVVRVIRAL
jgi:aminopeptidase N